MITSTTILLLLIAYLIGSIPSAVWVGKIFFKTDVREYGSGNAGATNTFRVLGPKAGIPVLLMDIGKGLGAVKMVAFSEEYLPGTQQYVTLKLCLGVAALMGHLFPVFAGFRGGKGVATMTGILIGVHPQTALICVGIFAITLLLTRYVSLSSMITALAFPFVLMLVFEETVKSMNIFSMAVAIMIFITHQKNIERLLRGKESKVRFRGSAEGKWESEKVGK